MKRPFGESNVLFGNQTSVWVFKSPFERKFEKINFNEKHRMNFRLDNNVLFLIMKLAYEEFMNKRPFLIDRLIH